MVDITFKLFQGSIRRACCQLEWGGGNSWNCEWQVKLSKIRVEKEEAQSETGREKNKRRRNCIPFLFWPKNE